MGERLAPGEEPWGAVVEGAEAFLLDARRAPSQHSSVFYGILSQYLGRFRTLCGVGSNSLPLVFLAETPKTAS